MFERLRRFLHINGAGLLAEDRGNVLADRKIEEQNRFLMDVINSIPNPFIVVDVKDYRVRIANRAAYQGELPASMTCHMLSHKSDTPCSSSEHPCPLRDVLATKEPVIVEHQHYDRSGALKSVEVHGYPVFDAEGSIVQYIEYVADITERKRYEAQLRRAMTEAEAANIAKSEFLANMSHEIRTPMNAIIGMTDLALTCNPSKEQWEYLELVKQAGESLLRIINDILDLSKVETGKMQLESVVFDLREVVAGSLEMFAAQAERKALVLNSVIAPDTPIALKGDPVRLRQVLINLIGNAIKFTNQGMVTVSVSVKRRGPADNDTADMLFTVSDTGIGIAYEKQRKIFESFTQADNSTTRQYGGTGLGLTICKRLTHLMNGDIWVESESGKGSTFRFTATFAAASEEPAAVTCQRLLKETGDTRPLQILLAEDNTLNQIVVTRTLEKLGHTVFVVGNGNDAITALQQQNFDVVLMDIQMPELDGIETTKIIRSSDFAPDVPIIALTANAMEGDRDLCLNAGMVDYVSKPVRREELVAALDRSVFGARHNEDCQCKHPMVSGEIISREKGLELFSGDTALYDHACGMFLVHAQQSLNIIRAAINDNDMETLERHAHSLKSMAGSIGAFALQDTALQMELAARRHEMVRIISLSERLYEHTKNLCGVLMETHC